MYVRHDSEARSRNHCCRGKAISIKYYECVSVFLFFLRRIILSCVAWLALPYFSTSSHKQYDFRKKVIKHKMCVFISYICLKHFSFWEEFSEIVLWMCVGLHVKYPLVLPDLIKCELSRQIFEKSSNIKFRENLSSGNRVVPCVQTDGRTDMTKLIVAFRNVANAPKINIYYIRKLAGIVR
jgi:hypothetical protein